MSALTDYDRALGSLVAGADEAGRGCLAGPIVGAAVLLDYERIDDRLLEALTDSKKLSERARERLYPVIRSAASAVAVSARSAATIDDGGLQVANYAVLAEPLRRVHVAGAVCLVDGYRLPAQLLPFATHRLVRGDSTSAAVAAASVIAKVTRDRMMVAADARWPDYGFARHKGYGTAAHREQLRQAGPCPMHRRSFAWGL